MPLFDNPFSMEIPIRIGRLNTVFFINNNLCVNNSECTSTPHCHHDFEIRYVERGTCNQIINKESYPVDAGNLLLIHPLEYHHQNSNNDSTQYNFRFSVTPPSAGDRSRRRAYDACLAILTGERYLSDTSGLLRLYLEQLTQEIYRKKDGYNENVRAICVLIFVAFLRMTNKPLGLLFPPEDFRYRGLNRTKIDEFFRQRYLTDIRIRDLAEAMNISERQVNRHMHKMFGMSFTQKLNDMRLENAANLLISDNRPIPHVAMQCGFKSNKYFYQCFKEKFGVSPQKYRINAKHAAEMKEKTQ